MDNLVDRCQPVREKLKEKGYKTTLDAFVVVMLGTIGSKKNDCLLSILGDVGWKYRTQCSRSFAVVYNALGISYEVWASKCLP